ncbi:Ankyrin repeat and SAM domain-containing protein 1A, partial [Durusdinium trenchii]
GEVPVLPSRTDCRACAPGHYSDGDTCRSCSFPFLLLDNTCVWWHLVLIIGLLALSSGIVFLLHHMAKRHRRKRTEIRQEEVSQILQEFEDELWDEKPETVNRFVVALSSFGWSWGEVSQRAQEMRARHSSHAGVSLAYLMGDFARLAYDWSGEENPTFLRLKEVFWQGDEKLGSNIRCPRDGRPGCALVDWLSPEHRRLQTHFMSWSWKYSLQQLQSAMQMWRSTQAMEFQDVFFYMCFFVNNQFRIIVEGSATGSDNLEEVFQTNLRRIGQVVAVLDTWEEPVYLQRVWTIYEQYVAFSLQVPVTFVMPEDAAASRHKKISRGDAGIEEVTQSLCDVNVAAARAFDPRDEQKVKTTIQSTVGFDQVNQHVKDAMIQWICVVVREKFQRLINRADREDVFSV